MSLISPRRACTARAEEVRHRIYDVIQQEKSTCDSYPINSHLCDQSSNSTTYGQVKYTAWWKQWDSSRHNSKEECQWKRSTPRGREQDTVFGKDKQLHNERLKGVMERVKDAKVTLNPNKCEFAKTKLKFLGHVIDQEGVAKGRPRQDSSHYRVRHSHHSTPAPPFYGNGKPAREILP